MDKIFFSQKQKSQVTIFPLTQQKTDKDFFSKVPAN